MAYVLRDRMNLGYGPQTWHGAGGVDTYDVQFFYPDGSLPGRGLPVSGSAWGSGDWWPDFGGYRGARGCNRYNGPSESWWNTNRKHD